MRLAGLTAQNSVVNFALNACKIFFHKCKSRLRRAGLASCRRDEQKGYADNLAERPCCVNNAKTVQTGLHSNPVEFDGIKTWIWHNKFAACIGFGRHYDVDFGFPAWLGLRVKGL
jgi:hypothetical protein